jgi:hypothetical protein
MHTREQDAIPPIDAPIPVQVKLGAAWTAFMFLYAYVDILGFYLPGVIDDILAGIVWEFRITQGWAVGALALMAVPILMIVLSTVLPRRANRITNLVVASLYVLVSVGNAVGEAWTFYYGLAAGLEVALLALVLVLAWSWRERVPAGPSRRVVPLVDRG